MDFLICNLCIFTELRVPLVLETEGKKMELKEYLQRQLNITSEEADKIVQCVKEYHHTYGTHGHHGPKQKDNEEKNSPFNLIVESEESVVANNYDLDKIHCNGCGRQCALSDPNCGRGRMTAQLIKNLV